MFDNIGAKIKKLAEIITIGGIIVSVLIGTMSGDFRGIVIALLGSLGSWISSFVLYGFGELIEKVTAIEKNTRVVTEIAPDINGQATESDDDAE